MTQSSEQSSAGNPLVSNAPVPSKAMVFAAGLGQRMRPVTCAIPKPLIKVGGKTLIDHMLDRFAEAGIKDAIVNVHYLPDMIIDHVKNRKVPRIHISDEREKLLDQGGGVAKVLDRIGDDPFFICNTDAFWISETRSNLQHLANMWDPDQMDILMLLAPVTGSVGVEWPGDFFMQPDGRLVRRAEKQVAPFVYTGVAIIKPSLFRADSREVFPLAPIFYNAAEQNKLFGLRIDGLWLHVGTPQAIGQAEDALSGVAA